MDEHLPISRLWWITSPLLVVLLAMVLVVAAHPVPYRVLMPGSARVVGPLVTVKAKEGGPVPHQEPPNEKLLFVTVSVRQPSGIEALWRLRNEADEVVPEKVVTGGQSKEQTNTFNLALMTASKDKAAKVALERAGYEVEVVPTGAVVVDLDPEAPVAKKLHPGDTIVGADGEEITTTDQARAVIGRHQPGDTIELRVQPLIGEERTERVRLRANPDDPTAPQLGVSLQDRPSYTFPVEISIDSGQVGGPSAGLAFTLTILDQLTPGRLTGPDRVAVTGTIELDGRVGPVGGVVQKTEAAISEGAKVFIVPDEEYDAAKEAARGRIAIRRVTDLDEALEVLREFGGTPVPAQTG